MIDRGYVAHYTIPGKAYVRDQDYSNMIASVVSF